MNNLNAVLAIAYRDLMKFLRDRPRIIGTFIFPFLFVGILGASLKASFGDNVGFDLLAFTFTGVLGQTLFQSSAMGLISLVDDRVQDFSQTVFVAPISRYAILFGKILGESAVSLAQALGILAFGIVLRVPMDIGTILKLIPVLLGVSLLGGAFGLVVLSFIGYSRRGAEQVFPLLLLPQFFLAGVFNPIRNLPLPIDILSHMAPMRYAIDWVRTVFYAGRPEYDQVVVHSSGLDLVVCTALFAVFLFIGTVLFVRNEVNR